MDRNEAILLAVQAIATKQRRERYDLLFWSKFKGSINKQGDKVNNDPTQLAPTGSVIEVNDGLKTHGLGDRMIVPMLSPLTGPGRYGDSVMLGHEESHARRIAYVHYNKVRKAAVLQEGEMDAIREDKIKAAEYCGPDLQDWMEKMENWDITRTFYEGISESLTTMDAAELVVHGNTLQLDKRFHPNLYVFRGATPAAGKLTRVGNPGKFPTMTQVFNAASGAAGDINGTDTGNSAAPLPMNTYCVRQMRKLVYSGACRIAPLFKSNGVNFWGVLIHPDQHDSLMNDDIYVKNLQSTLWKTLQENPMVNGSVGFYGNFVFFEDPVAVRGFAGANATKVNVLGTKELQYDKNDKSNPRFDPIEGCIEYSNLENKAAIIFGASALGEALHSKISYHFEDADYGNWNGIEARAIYGYERLDFVPMNQISKFENDVANITNVYNRSSAIIMTWQ